MRAWRRLGQLGAAMAVAVAGLVPSTGAAHAATVVVVTPHATAEYHEELTVEATTDCATTCEGFLLYRSGGALPATLDTFTSVTMEATGNVLRGTIPAEAVDTRGVEYLVKVVENNAVTWSPVAPVGTLTAPYRVRVPEPPHVVHAPRAVAAVHEAIALTAESTCVTTSCTGTIHWRTTGHEWAAAPMSAEPSAADPRLWSFTGAIPSSAATGEGVDYHIAVSDGHVTDSTPDHHVTVLVPTAIFHAPAATALYGVPIDVQALVACATETCSVELSYRTTGDGVLADDVAWTTVAMQPVADLTPIEGAASMRRWYFSIPGSAVGTEGVDYRIHAFDGHTNAHSPGTAYIGTPVNQTDGQGTYWYHVHVAEPVRIVHAPDPHAEYGTTFTIKAEANCATGTCSATLGYRVSDGLDTLQGIIDWVGVGGPFTEVPMDGEIVTPLTGGQVVMRFTASIPPEAMTTDGIDYWIRVTDGSTTAYFPGTSYIGAIGSVDGRRVAHQHVEVGSRPVVTHVQPPYYRQGIELELSARVSVDKAITPTARLWFKRVADATYGSASMEVTATVVAGVYELRGELPAALTSTGSPLMYVIEVSDGHLRGFSPVTAATPVSPMIGHVIYVNAPLDPLPAL